MQRVILGLTFSLVAVIVVLCNAALLVLAVPDATGLALSFLAAVLPAGGFVFLVLRLDRFEHEPLILVAGAFFWGAAVATLFAAIANLLGGVFLTLVFGEFAGEFLTVALVAPVVEETVKGAALLVLLVFMRRDFDNVLDGILYGSVVGLGFAMTENIFYFGSAYMEGGVPALGMLFYLRVMLGGLAHAVYTGTTGAGIGFLRESRSRRAGAVVAVVAFMLAIVQHSAWNAIPATFIPVAVPDTEAGVALALFVLFPVAAALFIGPGLVILLTVAFFAARSEMQLLRHHLRPELEAGVITADEYRLVASPFGRSLAEWGTLLRRGIGPWLRQRQIHQLATDIAFSRWHESRGEFVDTAAASQQRYRQQIAALRA